MADMGQFSGGRFIKLEAVADGQKLVKVIRDITFGEKFGRPDLNFDDDTSLSLNVTNNKSLSVAMGKNSDDWIGKKVELSGAQVPFEDKMVNSIILTPLEEVPFERRTPPDKTPLKKTPIQQAPQNDMDDSIPF
jgi:hypothetical protein